MTSTSLRSSLCLLAAILCLTAVPANAQSRFDKWKFPTRTTKKGANGLEGVVDASGQWVVQPYFDFLHFPYRCYLGEAKYKGSDKYYVIDRNFNIVGNGTYPFTDITPYYVIVRDYPNCYAINARGQRISDIYTEIQRWDYGSDWEGELIFCRRKDNGKWDILGADMKRIGNGPVDGDRRYGDRMYDVCPYTMRNNADGHDEKIIGLIRFVKDRHYGLMNLAGEIIVPPIYANIDNLYLDEDIYTKTKYKGAQCTPEQLERTALFTCETDRGTIVVCDAMGQTVIPEQKRPKYMVKHMAKNMVKYLGPYLARANDNDKLWQSRVTAPYYEFIARVDKCLITEVPKTAKTQNLLAMAQADQAQKDRLLAQQQRKEAAARQRQQAQARANSRSTSTQTSRRSTAQAQTRRSTSQASANIPHPAYGTLPSSNSTYFYGKTGGKAGEVSLNITGHANGGCWIQLRAYNLGIYAHNFGPDNVKYEGDYIVVGGRFFQPGFLNYTQGTYIDAPTIKIAKDWSHIIYIDLQGRQSVYDRPIAEAVYRQHEANVNRYNAQHGLFEHDKNYQRQEAEYNNRRAQEMRSNSPSGNTQRSQSSTSRPANKKMDVRVDDPNYTGSTERAWCEQCQKWDIPHRHIKK